MKINKMKMKHISCTAAVRLLQLSLLVVAMGVSSCGHSDGILSDKAYRNQVLEDLAERRDLLSRCDALSAVDDPTLTVRERDALQFLYAYMPISDAINYDGEFFVRQVRRSEKTRGEMSWGAKIPDNIYRHFVLPIRVNNEDIDDSRTPFHDELAPRVEGLSMADAILEVNHWCHEKAVYAPTDPRTSAPLATVRTTLGRCGEESTLLVAALRSVGIPARQVYTPRWAHTDSNHAWVEAWADGTWHFLGACEPEPVLDLGWFNGPASRGMLLHTNVFGRYEGPEQIMRRTRLLTEINITENYAPIGHLSVLIVDADGNPVPDATVEYKVYNYSNLSTIATQTTDAEGHSSLISGRGDLVVWASKDEHYGFAKATVADDTEITVALEWGPGARATADFLIVPPPEGCELPPVSDEQREENTLRMTQEDSIRNVYVATFRTTEQGEAFAKANGLDPKRTAPLLVESKGNYAEIEAFLKGAVEAGEGSRALTLLEGVMPKDLHDTPREVFEDHLYNSRSEDLNVLNPRAGTELLSSYRAYLQQVISEEEAALFREDPQRLVAWCCDSIRMVDDQNLQLVPVRPVGVWKSRLADRTSRELFFVAVCRSLEIPVRRDMVTTKLFYTVNGNDYEVNFEAQKPVFTAKGTLKLDYRPTAAAPDPRYNIHFTVSRIENGRARQLQFGMGASWDKEFRQGTQLEVGDYMLLSGTRLDGGEVLAEVRLFSITEAETTVVDLEIPTETRSAEPIGSFRTSARYRDADGNLCALSDALGDGFSVLGVLGAGEEPTNHALHDMAAFRESLEKLGVPIRLLFASEENARRYVASDFPALPANVRFGCDVDGVVSGSLAAGANLGRTELPLIAVVDASGQIFYLSSGYSIGLGERLVRELSAR